jgi:hypothetical protein
MALGAAPAGVLRLEWQGWRSSSALGSRRRGLSLWTSTFVSALLYGLQLRDPFTIGGAVMVRLEVGGLAGLDYCTPRGADRSGLGPATELRAAKARGLRGPQVTSWLFS